MEHGLLCSSFLSAVWALALKDVVIVVCFKGYLFYCGTSSSSYGGSGVGDILGVIQRRKTYGPRPGGSTVVHEPDPCFSHP